ncbi:NADH dehydrogenase FAD-containing subunit [Halobacteriales archaeon SW_5_70_135]|nr:MAG: NADH dehydrogenase FAD-containing subunit [Halobacteriales archaeon SW_5_70_135]
MRVAVLGAGYAGVAAARELESRLPRDVEIVLVDEDGRHLVRHEVHRVVRRPSVVDAIELDAADLLDRTTVRRARVADLDPDAGVADLDPTGGADDTPPTEDSTDADPLSGAGADPGDTSADGTDDPARLGFDYAVVTIGAETAFHDLPGVREHATPLKSVADAEAVRETFLGLPAGGRFVVGGAGLSGVQLAGELAALAAERDLDREVVVVEMADSVAPSFAPRFQSAVRTALEGAGVDVRTGWCVERADAATVRTDRGEIAYDGFAWTGGIRGDEALAGERPVVDRHLRLGERVFGAGDAVRVVDVDGEPVPAAAQTAIRQAPVAAENVARLVDHDYGRNGDSDSDDGGFRPRLSSYRYESLGWVVSVGDDAVAQLGPTVLWGRPAVAAKTAVGAGYLSKVGAVRRSVDLLNEELGLGDAVHGETPVDAE